jgi:alkaline phosphatase D|tara:strand:- start:169 stop:309 length:141 start_codon:yes stop_codon:yes gene_type:complete
MLPRERDRLYAALDRRAGGAVVMLSGDRHVGGLYREPARGIVDATA